MPFLYHRVPKVMRGTELCPLNLLRERHPDLYTEERKKYLGREWLSNRNVPILGCSWHSAIQLSAIHPAKIKAELAEIGRALRGEWWEIDVAKINLFNAVVFVYSKTVYVEDDWDLMEFVPLKAADIAEYAEPTPAMREHYREAKAAGRELFPYHRTPHILCNSTLDTRTFKKIVI